MAPMPCAWLRHKQPQPVGNYTLRRRIAAILALIADRCRDSDFDAQLYKARTEAGA